MHSAQAFHKHGIAGDQTDARENSGRLANAQPTQSTTLGPGLELVSASPELCDLDLCSSGMLGIVFINIYVVDR